MDAHGNANTSRSAPNLVELYDGTQELTLLQVAEWHRLTLCVVSLGCRCTSLWIDDNLEVQSWRVTLLGARLDRGLVHTLGDNLTRHLLAQYFLGVLSDVVKHTRVQLGKLLKDLGLVEAQRQRVTYAARCLILVLTQTKRRTELRKLKDQLTTTSRVQVHRLATLSVLANIGKGHVGGIEGAEHLESHLVLCSTVYTTEPFMWLQGDTNFFRVLK